MYYNNYAVNAIWRDSKSLYHSPDLVTLRRSSWSPIIARLLKYVFRNLTPYGQVALKISEVSPSSETSVTGHRYTTGHTPKTVMFSAVVREQRAGEEGATRIGNKTEDIGRHLVTSC
jgi:hypothetical protein